MSDFWKQAATDAKDGAAAYKKAKAKKDQVKGILDDITKLHSVASHLLEYNTSSSSVLLKFAFEGVERLANKYGGNAPVLNFFFRYHKPHVDLLANVLRGRNEAEFAVKWQQGAEKISKRVEGTVKELVAKNGFAGPMLNENGKLSSNLPRAFRDFCEADAHDTSTDARAAREMAEAPRSQRWIDSERERLGVIILHNARDIAGAYLTIAAEVEKFSKSMTQASKVFRKLNKGDTDSDSVFGSAADYAMQSGAIMAGGTRPGSQAFEEVQMFTSGNHVKTPSFQRMGRSYRDMRVLSENWKQWAKSVGQGSHLNMY